MNLNLVSSPNETTKRTTATDVSPRLENAAHQFEASLLTQLLKPMQERSEFSDSGFSDSDDGDDESADGSMREYATEAMAQCLSEHGGIGIAKMVLAKLGPVEAAREREGKSGEKNRPAR